MKIFILNFLINYNVESVTSLDIKFFQDIFSVSWFFSLNINFFNTIQELLELFILNSYFYINIISISYILIALFWNMFHYSARYYFVNFIFNHKKLILPNNRTLRLDWALAKWGYWNLIILPYYQADAMLTICLVLSLVIAYNILMYTNFFNLQLPRTSITIFFNVNIAKWISLYFDVINFGILIDNLSLMMLVVVLSISTLVHYYSIDYMASDPWLLTFLKYLSGFTLAMLILVLANNFALMFLGWEGVGIFSYLLIGFWYTRTLALKASLKAVIVNRIGDVALIIASALIIQYFGTLEFKKLQFLFFYLIEEKISLFNINFEFFQISVIGLITFFLLIAAVGKSAQFGLHTWLPDAMEGPTPVSALIHAATMVTAGVYLIVRTSFFFEFSDFVWNLTLIIGAFTALFGSITACFQYDIKRIIAFSTCSQLGYMFLACGLSAYNLAMFHLFIHAFFKALLFLCAGSVIHAINDEQDIRKMGGLLLCLPITYTGLCIGFFSLAGLPFTSGFFSKDTIIELALTKWTIPALYAYICASLGAWFTAFYSIRFFYYVIFNDTNLSRTIILSAHEHGWNMLNVISILAIITIFVGGLTKNPLTSPFSFIFFSNSIFIKNYNFYFNIYEIFLDFYLDLHDYFINYLKYLLLLIPFFAVYVAILVFWHGEVWASYDVLYDKSNEMSSLQEKKNYVANSWGIEFYTDNWLQKFFETKSSADQVYNFLIVKPILNFSYEVSYKELDWGWLEFFFIKLPTNFCFFFSKILNQNFGSLKLNFLPTLFFMATLLFSILILFLN